MLESEAGLAELRILAGAEQTTAPSQGGGGGLFSHIEDKLEPIDLDPPSTKPQTSGKTSPMKQQLPAVEDASNAGEATEPSKPSTEGGVRDLKKCTSSEEFMKSALMRHSIVPSAATDPEAVAAALKTISSGEASEGSGNAIEDEFDDNDDPDSHNATGMGCTAVSVLIHHGMVTVANTGDSRCVISRKGEATPLTLDHKPIIYEEAQRIIRAGGFVRDNRVNGALNVSRTIGDLDFKRNTELPHTEQMVVATPDITDFELQDGDEFLILACDGIWDVLSNQEAVDFVRKRIKQGQALKSICEAMCDFCLAPDLKGMCRGADNMSVIIVLFKKHADLESLWYKMWHGITSLFGGK